MSERLQNLGNEIIRLSRIWYGTTYSPFEKANDISKRTGINADLVQAALLATEGGGGHA